MNRTLSVEQLLKPPHTGHTLYSNSNWFLPSPRNPYHQHTIIKAYTVRMDLKILDSACSMHICNDLSRFYNFRKVQKEFVQAGLHWCLSLAMEVSTNCCARRVGLGGTGPSGAIFERMLGISNYCKNQKKRC